MMSLHFNHVLYYFLPFFLLLCCSVFLFFFWGTQWWPRGWFLQGPHKRILCKLRFWLYKVYPNPCKSLHLNNLTRVVAKPNGLSTLSQNSSVYLFSWFFNGSSCLLAVILATSLIAISQNLKSRETFPAATSIASLISRWLCDRTVRIYYWHDWANPSLAKNGGFNFVVKWNTALLENWN